jgi:ABC-2 type transport system permease protein
MAVEARNKVFRQIFDNPVVLKELRGRMRGARAFVVLTIYLALLGAFSSLVYVAVSESSTNASGPFTSGAISGEREHQTYDLLRTTLLPSHSFVLGKLLSAMLYVLLLLLAAIPLQSIAFFFGGVAETEIALSFVILAATALLFSTIGIYFSARANRTLSASVMTYATAMFIMFGLPLVLGAIMLLFGFSLSDVRSSNTDIALLYFSGGLLSLNPAATAVLTQYILLNQRTVGVFSYTLSGGDKVTLISPWIPFTVIYLLLTVVFFVLAVRRVRHLEE